MAGSTRRSLFAAAPALAMVPAFAALSAHASVDWSELERLLSVVHRDGAVVMRHIKAAAKQNWGDWEDAYGDVLRATMKPTMLRGIVLTAFETGDQLLVLFSTATTGARHPGVLVSKEGAKVRFDGVWFV